MGVGKRGAYQLVHGDAQAAPVSGTTLRFTGPVPAGTLSSERHLCTQLRDPMAYGGLNKQMDPAAEMTAEAVSYVLTIHTYPAKMRCDYDCRC